MAKAKTTPEALKLKVCSKKVRRAGIVEQCGKEYLGPRCPIEDHLLPMPTGHCLNGWHEGSKATSASGKPAPTCTWITRCPCQCHADLDRLFAMTDQERIVVESSGYAPPHRDYWMPQDDLDAPVHRSSDDDGRDTPPRVESAAPGIVPPPVARDFTPTESGRTPKGQLEAWIKDATDVWLIDQPGFPCTPVWIANEIAHTQGITPPSVGAISACFDRWVKLGFAVIEKKPTRFTGYTEEGVRLGLERMKNEKKRSARLQLADDRRNLRRN